MSPGAPPPGGPLPDAAPSGSPPPGRRRRPQRATPAGRKVLAIVIPVIALLVIVIGLWVTWGGNGSDQAAQTTPTTVDVLFIEGLRRSEMAEILQKKTGIPAADYMKATDPSALGQRLAGTKKPTSLEGFLFPATYPVDPKKPVTDLVNYQLDTFTQRTEGISYKAAKRKNLTKYDVLIIASLVEREASTTKERRIIAGVIENRLRARMRLDIDATVQYAVGSWKAELTKDDLAIASPYNTRKYFGLPPGPICNPGEDSLKAAANPIPSKYLFYVSKNDGTDLHYFATTEAEHIANIKRAAANGGG
ncbi:MAG: endolytic transglycosylase MltG [Acidobacteria bacterium]|nr:endolytic transglycosylase MltG [Acidobacteriota bacterium]